MGAPTRVLGCGAVARILFVSYDGLIGDIAWECVKEGEDVRFWIKDPEEQCDDGNLIGFDGCSATCSWELQ